MPGEHRLQKEGEDAGGHENNTSTTSNSGYNKQITVRTGCRRSHPLPKRRIVTQPHALADAEPHFLGVALGAWALALTKTNELHQSGF